ncbi:multidrug resistance A domain protein, partial [Bordetella holmesii 41130]
RTFYVQNDSLAADVDVRQADIGRAQADLNRAQSDLKRRQALAASGGVSGEEILPRRNHTQDRPGRLAQARAALASGAGQASHQSGADPGHVG